MEPVTKRTGSMNWTSGKLFRRRLSRYWREQWRVWRTVLDWTVCLYIVLPALWIGGGLYLELWNEPASWMNQIPLWTMKLPALLIINLGILRTFAEEADVLFLLQKPDWRRGLILRGISYTAVGRGFMIALLFALLIPFLAIIHKLSWMLIAEMIIVTWLWAIIGSLCRNLLDGRYRGWRRMVWKAAASALLSASYVIPIFLYAPQGIHLVWQTAVGLLLIVVLLPQKLRARDTFESDVQQEHRARLASTELLLSQVIERKPRIKMNKPIILRSSKRLFKSFDPATMLAEDTIKTFLRRLSLIRIWLSFFGISTMAVLLSPSWVKVLLFILLPLLLSRWVQTLCDNFVHEPFIEQFQWSDPVRKQMAEKVRFWLVLPVAVVIGLVAGLQMFGIVGLLAGAAAGLYWWKANEIMSDILMLKSRKKGTL